jgi:hypothetical protein
LTTLDGLFEKPTTLAPTPFATAEAEADAMAKLAFDEIDWPNTPAVEARRSETSLTLTNMAIGERLTQ